MGASNAGGLGKKRNSGRISGFAAYRSTLLSIVGVAKCKNNSRDERRQASSTRRGVCHLSLAQEDDKVFVTCLTLYAGDEGGLNSPPPWLTPFFSAAVGQNPENWHLPILLTLSDPRGGVRTPTDPRMAANKGGYDLGVFVRGVWSDTVGDNSIGDSRTEFSRILCTSKSEVAVTSNKKLRCGYVLANYWQTWSITRPLCDSRATCTDCSLNHCDQLVM